MVKCGVQWLNAIINILMLDGEKYGGNKVWDVHERNSDIRGWKWRQYKKEQ